MVEGFRFSIDANECSGVLPISRKMFFRHSMVECIPNSVGPDQCAKEDNAILSLLFKQNEVAATLSSRSTLFVAFAWKALIFLRR